MDIRFAAFRGCSAYTSAAIVGQGRPRLADACYENYAVPHDVLPHHMAGTRRHCARGSLVRRYPDNGAADRVPSKVRSLDYIDAVVPDDNQWFYDMVPIPAVQAQWNAASTIDGFSVPPIPAAVFGDNDISADSAPCPPNGRPGNCCSWRRIPDRETLRRDRVGPQRQSEGWTPSAITLVRRVVQLGSELLSRLEEIVVAHSLLD